MCFCARLSVCPRLALVLCEFVRGTAVHTILLARAAMHFVSHGVVHVCLYVYLKVGDSRLMRWWTLCVQEGFHSAVKCWFVISGLDRLVMRKSSFY